MSRAILCAVMGCLVGSSAVVCAQPKKQSSVVSRQPAANNKQIAANRQPSADSRRAAPIPPPTREQMPPQPPRVSFRNGLLSIHADNSTMADVMSAVRRSTGASLDLPPSAASERVVTDIGPAAPNDALVKLLDGSRFDYVILQSPQNPALVQLILLHEKGAPTTLAAGAAPAQPIFNQPQPEPPTEVPEDQTEPPAQEIPDQAAPAQDQQQQQTPEGQQQPKTPEQLLEELKQMQRQQQQPGQQPQPEQPQQEQPQGQQPDGNPQAPQMMDTPIPQ